MFFSYKTGLGLGWTWFFVRDVLYIALFATCTGNNRNGNCYTKNIQEANSLIKEDCHEVRSLWRQDELWKILHQLRGILRMAMHLLRWDHRPGDPGKSYGTEPVNALFQKEWLQRFPERAPEDPFFRRRTHLPQPFWSGDMPAKFRSLSVLLSGRTFWDFWKRGALSCQKQDGAHGHEESPLLFPNGRRRCGKIWKGELRERRA